MHTRTASLDDAAEMSRVLREIIAHTGRERPNDEAFVTRQYIANPASIRCTIATDNEAVVLGFQSLVRAEADNRYDVPAGWGIIGTHISPRAHRQGVGSALFQSSREAAEEAGLEKIDAYIGADNPSGLRYYEAMGFQTYRAPEGIVQKVYMVGYGKAGGAAGRVELSTHSAANMNERQKLASPNCASNDRMWVI